MAEEGIGLDFDPSSMISGIKDVVLGWTGMTSAMDATSKKTSKSTESISDGVGQVGQATVKAGSIMTLSWKKVLAIMALAYGAFQTMKAALLQMPEIQMTFRIAKDIFWRNFLQPIRKELLPILQKVLNWVRDNRAAFVKWGALVKEVIRVVIHIATTFFKLLKSAFAEMKKVLVDVFGKSIMNIENMIRVVITKIAALVIYASIVLEPLFKAIGKVVGVAIVGVIAFFRGLFKAMEPVIPIFEDLVKTLTELFKTIAGNKEDAKAFKNIMRVIGKIVGTVLVYAFQTLANWITYVSKVLQGIVKGFRAVAKAIGLDKAILKLEKAWDKFAKKFFKFMKPSKTLLKILEGLGYVIGSVLAVVILAVVKGITWLVEGVSFLIDLFEAFFGSTEKTSKGMKKMSNSARALKHKIEELKKPFRDMAKWIGSNILKPIGKLGKGMKKIATSVGKFIDSIFKDIKKMIKGALDWIDEAIEKLLEIVGLSKKAKKASKGPATGIEPEDKSHTSITVPRGSGVSYEDHSKIELLSHADGSATLRKRTLILRDGKTILDELKEKRVTVGTLG